MAHVYVVVSSNSSMEIYPDNKLSSFKVKLGKPLELTGAYEVGLVEIIYPNKSLNVQENEAKVHTITEHTESIPIPPWPENKVGPKPKEIKKGTPEEKKLAENALKAWKNNKKAYNHSITQHKRKITRIVGPENAKKMFKLKKLPAFHTKISQKQRSVALNSGLYLNVSRLVEALQQTSEHNGLKEN